MKLNIGYKRAAIAALSILEIISLSACGSEEGKTDKGEEAAAVEEAVIDGREAARVFVQRNWKDTTELQQRLLEARARQSRYRMEGREQSARAFDSAFVSTIRTVRPDVARELDKNPAARKGAGAKEGSR